jgi:hypothetical protein
MSAMGRKKTSAQLRCHAYRAYFLDGVNRFTRTEAVAATSDEHAVREATVIMGDALKCEIWDRQRLVAKIKADDSPE